MTATTRTNPMHAPSCPSAGPGRARRGPVVAGFTLIEILVVIAIVSLLVGLFIPALAAAKEAARLTKCLSNLRSIGQALTSYSDDNREHFPYWSGWQVWGGDGTGNDSPGPGWTELLASETSGREVFVDPSRPRDQVPFAYFLQSRFTYAKAMRLYSSLRTADVTIGSKFVIAGDCNNPALYAAPYGAAATEPDCDQDDATQPAAFFDGELSAHKGRTNLVMIDGHACAFTPAMASTVTWHGSKMADWSNANCGATLGPP